MKLNNYLIQKLLSDNDGMIKYIHSFLQRRRDNALLIEEGRIYLKQLIEEEGETIYVL